ncbi:hypothetical protein JW998_08550 [candidate division KSB1 bacterium]|nr:hypothetical protein [candidate division KSB1 bacterium]
MAIEFSRLDVACFFTLILCTTGAPQPQGPYFEHLSTQDGLSNDIIMSIIQYSRGFMWFGTFDGLNRYDGYQFIQYFNEPADFQKA